MLNVDQLFHDREQRGDEAGDGSTQHEQLFSDVFGHAWPLHFGVYSNDEEQYRPEKAYMPTGRKSATGGTWRGGHTGLDEAGSCRGLRSLLEDMGNHGAEEKQQG